MSDCECLTDCGDDPAVQAGRGKGCMNWRQWQAQRRLHDAAPDLLEALKALEMLFSPCVRDCTQADWIDKARAAIAKAEGSS